MEVDKQDETFYHDENTHKWTNSDYLKALENEDWELESQLRFPLIILARYSEVVSMGTEAVVQQLPNNFDVSHYLPLANYKDFISPLKPVQKKLGG